ncbi:MAG TPA: hypothetical protein VF761_15630 [Gemmatimonadaceae bacterium]
MSDTEKKLPIVEIVIFALVVIGAAIAWNTRASRAIPPGAKPAAGVQPAPASGWSAKAARRPHHRPPLSAEATDRAEQLCVDMVRTQLAWRLKDSVVTAEATDRYGVGDHDSGAGDSLIVEGTARTVSGATHRFACSMSTLSSFYGGPLITFPDLTR